MSWVNWACACHHIIDHSCHQSYVFFCVLPLSFQIFHFINLLRVLCCISLLKDSLSRQHRKVSWLTLLKDPLSRSKFCRHFAIHRIKHRGEDAWKIMRFQDICSLFPSPHLKRTAYNVCRECYATTLERPVLLSRHTFVKCDKLPSAKSQYSKLRLQAANCKVEIIAFKSTRDFEELRFRNLTRIGRKIFLRISSSMKWGFLSAS